METFPEDPYDTVKARIVSDDEREMMGAGGGGDHGIAVLGCGGLGHPRK